MDHGNTHDMMQTVMLAVLAGTFLMALSRRINVSAIVLLLTGGVVLGPEVFGLVKPDSLGEGLGVLVSLAVGIILFEGGLTLELSGFRAAPKVIPRLLTVGLVVTWLATAFAFWLFFHDQVTLGLCLLAGSLVTVTGPTVIAPLLKRIKVNHNLHSILHWEGILIDPLGVFLAILCFEWLIEQSGGVALGNFAMRTLAGLAIGCAGAALMLLLLRFRFFPEEQLNIGALGIAVGTFGAAELMLPESGLLSVTVAGFLVGIQKPAELKQIKHFKSEIVDLLIGVLFILLSARLELAQFKEFGIPGALMVATVIFIVRPMNIFASAYKTDLTLKERAFLSWVAPRGIVAASMASFITLSLERTGRYENVQLLETFVYSVITATVLLQGFTAGPVAALLGLKRPPQTGWLIVGAHAFGREVARHLRDHAKMDVLLIDSNARAVKEARDAGLKAVLDAIGNGLFSPFGPSTFRGSSSTAGQSPRARRRRQHRGWGGPYGRSCQSRRSSQRNYTTAKRSFTRGRKRRRRRVALRLR